MPGNISYPSKDPMIKFAREMRIRNFSDKTIIAYLHYNNELLRFASKFSDDITKEDIKDYIDYLITNNKSRSTIDVVINAVKLYYCAIMKRRFFDEQSGIIRPKKEKKLPVVLSKNEIIRMIAATDNIKHKLIIQILYTSGLRVNELRNLQINQIDFERKTIFVKAGKGKKDRITIISKTTLDNIEKYLAQYQPLKYLFESHIAGNKMSDRSLQKVVASAAQKAGIGKPVSPHALRHSFATHLLENNVNLRYIQAMLGHARLETTQIYTRVAANKLEEIGDLL